MKTTDWNLIKVQYELFGYSTEELAEEYNVPVRMVELAAEDHNWKRLPVADKVHNWKDLKTIDESTLDDISYRLKLLQTLKESALGPKYIILETAILNRAIEIMQNLNPQAESATDKLKMVSEILQNLQGKRIREADAANGNGSGGVKVSILNYVGDRDRYVQSQEKIDITIDGQSVAPHDNPSPAPPTV